MSETLTVVAAGSPGLDEKVLASVVLSFSASGPSRIGRKSKEGSKEESPDQIEVERDEDTMIIRKAGILIG